MFGSDTVIAQFRGPWGVPIQIGGSIIFLALLFISFSGGPEDLIYSLAFFALLVFSIYLHELGHAWGALVQGVAVRRVMIYGGGGFCEHAPSTRGEDELIVPMGPLVNLAVWALASLAAPYVNNPYAFWMLMSLASINFFLFVLNLVPVFPLDGGRILNLILNRFVQPGTASRISGAIGLLCAILWIPAMLLSFYFLGFLLLFFPPIKLHWQLLKGEITA